MCRQGAFVLAETTPDADLREDVRPPKRLAGYFIHEPRVAKLDGLRWRRATFLAHGAVPVFSPRNTAVSVKERRADNRLMFFLFRQDRQRASWTYLPAKGAVVLAVPYARH